MVFNGNPEAKNKRLLIEICVLLMAFVAIMFFLSNEVKIGGAAIVGLSEPTKLIHDGVVVDMAVVNQLDEEDLVSVIIELKDVSNIIEIKDTEKFEIKKDLVKIQQEKVLSKLSDEERRIGILTISKKEIEVDRKYETVDAISAKISRSGLQKLKNNPNVKAVHEDRTFTTSLIQSIPLINADDVRNINVGGGIVDGSGEAICIIDTGIDNSHPAFAGRIIAQQCYCSVSNKGAGGCCPNNQISDTNAQDDASNSHGTHVAGIAAGAGSYPGVAPGVNIVAVKVCDSTGACTASDILSGIDYCNNNYQIYNVSVISASLGDGGQYDASNCPTVFDSSLQTSNNLDITATFASGNNGYSNGINYPACSPTAVSVGATDDNDNIASFSNRGALLDLLAPGVSITSTIIGGGYGSLSGTSMATPHAAGAAALIYQNERLSNRTISPASVKELMQQTGVPVQSYSRVDAYAAIVKLNKNITINQSASAVTKQNIGEIKFEGVADLGNITECSELSYNHIEINSSLCPQYNKPAVLTIDGLPSYSTVQVFKDNVPCMEPFCKVLSNTAGTVVFNVTGFSVYSVQGINVSGNSSYQDMYPAVTVKDYHGSYHMVWQRNDGAISGGYPDTFENDDWNVYYSMSNDGVNWSTPMLVSVRDLWAGGGYYGEQTQTDIFPDVSVGEDGMVWVVWQSNRKSNAALPPKGPYDWHIFKNNASVNVSTNQSSWNTTSLTMAGAEDALDLPKYSSNGFDDINPSVDVDGDNVPHIVWQTNRDDGEKTPGFGNATFQYDTLGGGTAMNTWDWDVMYINTKMIFNLSIEEKIEVRADDSDEFPDIVATNDSEGISLHVVWHAENSSDYRVFYENNTNISYIVTGGKIKVQWNNTPIVLNQSTTGYDDMFPQIDANRTHGGKLYVVWQSDRDSSYSGNSFPLYSDPGPGLNSAYSITDSNWTIYKADSTDYGISWTSSRIVDNSSNNQYPTIAVAEDGTQYVTWQRLVNYTTEDWDLYSADSSNWNAQTVVLSDSAIDSHPSIDTGTVVHYAFHTNRTSDFEVQYGKQSGNVSCGSFTASTSFANNVTVNGSCFTFDYSNIVVNCNNYYVLGNGSGTGFLIDKNNITIQNCGIKGFTYGIKVNNTDNQTLSGNAVLNNSYGINIDPSYNNEVISNQIFGSSICGLCLEDSNNNTIRNNTIMSNAVGLNISGTSVENRVYYNNFSNNDIHADSVSGNNFNTTVSGIPQGNSWSDVSGLQIYDNNFDNYGELGYEYPYNSTWGNVLNNITDWGPVTSKQEPNTTLMTINSTSANNYTDEDLKCYAKGTEQDSDPLTPYFRWFNSSGQIFAGSTSISNGTLSLVSTLANANTTKWQNWTCSVLMSDGPNNETEWNNVTLIVVNKPPTYNTSNPIGNLQWLTNTNYTINFSDHFYDVDFDDINYTSNDTQNITIIISNVSKNATLVPDFNWTGTQTATFYAFDEENANTTSGSLNLKVSWCGDNLLQNAEQCDGTNLSGQSCSTQGFSTGSLACYAAATANECTFDTSSCSNPSGGGGGSSTPPTVPPVVPPPIVPPPTPPPPAPPPTVPPAAAAPSKGGSPIPASVRLPAKISESVTCINVSDTEVPVVVKEEEVDIPVPRGYDVAVEPFSLTCEGDVKLDFTITVPNTFTDLQAVKCVGGECNQVVVERVQKLKCGDVVTEVSRAREYLAPEFFPVKIAEKEVQGNYLESDKIKVKLMKNIPGISLKLKLPKQQIAEPKNPSLKIVSTPIIIELNKKTEAMPAEITIPFASDPQIDLNSVAIYIYDSEGWQYIGGEIDTENNVVNVNVDNLAEFMSENNEDNKGNKSNEVLFALMGIICVNCEHPSFESVYQPPQGGGNAVVMVHGLGSSPEAYNDIINDIRLTRQPWQAWTFGYPSDRANIDNAKDFADEIEANVNKFENIYIVAHSLGAVISQQTLNYAYNENLKNPGKYTFINKVRKAILIGAPNDKIIGNEMFINLVKYAVNLKTKADLFDPNSRGILDLLEGDTIPRVPFVKYYVIAGTRPYEFNTAFFKLTTEQLFEVIEPNDGIVTIKSAQHIGDTYINDHCENYFEIDETHTDLIDNPDARIIMEKIIAREILKDISQIGELGRNKYYDLHVDKCSAEDKYVIIGKKIREEKAADPTGCSCGNGYCGEDENEVSCPVDCARFLRKENICSKTTFFSLLALFLLITTASVVAGITIKSEAMLRRITTLLITLGSVTSVITIVNMLICLENYVVITQSALMIVTILALSMLKLGKFRLPAFYRIKMLFFDADRLYALGDVKGTRKAYNQILKLYKALSHEKQAKHYKALNKLYKILSKKK